MRAAESSCWEQALHAPLSILQCIDTCSARQGACMTKVNHPVAVPAMSGVLVSSKLSKLLRNDLQECSTQGQGAQTQSKETPHWTMISTAESVLYSCLERQQQCRPQPLMSKYGLRLIME